ncbi:hypothetical protein CFP56_020313 [Quercus suber]|uniref:Chalcone-flavonone isomerase family protein n=1 Tax=Quercus suber TaxID=58331 RepID=A0AAW0KFH3_QUESU
METNGSLNQPTVVVEEKKLNRTAELVASTGGALALAVFGQPLQASQPVVSTSRVSSIAEKEFSGKTLRGNKLLITVEIGLYRIEELAWTKLELNLQWMNALQ